MEQLIELLKQIQELAGAGVDALEGATKGGGEKPPEGGKPPGDETPGKPEENPRPPGDEAPGKPEEKY